MNKRSFSRRSGDGCSKTSCGSLNSARARPVGEGHPCARHRARLGASSGSRSAAASLRSWTAREQQPRHFLDKQRYAAGAVHHCRQGSAAFRDRGRCDLRFRRSATRISSACHDEPDIEVLFRQQFRRDLRTDCFTLEFAQSAPMALSAHHRCRRPFAGAPFEQSFRRGHRSGPVRRQPTPLHT
jgi:hypothetical protein